MSKGALTVMEIFAHAAYVIGLICNHIKIHFFQTLVEDYDI